VRGQGPKQAGSVPADRPDGAGKLERKPQRKRASNAGSSKRRGASSGKPDPCQPASDDTGRRILESLANPALRALTIEERCELLGIARSTWYRHTSEDPLFRARAIEAFRQTCDEELGPILDALCSSAKFLGKEGHQDRKLYLGLLGIYEQGSVAGGRRSVEEEEHKSPTQTMTDAEMLAHFAGREHLLPPGVQRRLGVDPDSRPMDGPSSKPAPPAAPAKKAA